MEEQTWYEVFLENLHEQFPKKAQLTQEIMDLLCLEREAVYRRLRKDVPFPAHEVIKIASTWNISLDEILGIDTGKIMYRMQPFNYLDPTKQEFNNMQKRVSAIDHLRTTYQSEYMEVCNRLPRPLSIGFNTLYRFRIFDWAYQYNSGMYREFSKISIPEFMQLEFDRYKKNIVHAKNTQYIFDQKIFDCLVYSVHYFHSILLITDDEKELIKKELHEMLDYLMEIATKGCYPETHNKVTLYISQLNIDTNYSYFYTEKLKVCRVHAFGKFDVSSYDANMVKNFRTWMNLKKRSSIQISEVNERQRIEYFVRQRKLVDGM